MIIDGGAAGAGTEAPRGASAAVTAEAIAVELDAALERTAADAWRDLVASGAARAESAVHPPQLAFPSALRRFLAPQREALGKLAAIVLPWLSPEHRARIGEVADRMTRTVEDSVLMMATLSRPDWRDGMSLPPANINWFDLKTDVKGKCVGLMMNAGCGLAVEAAGRRQYVQFLAKGVVGVDAATGRFLWRYDQTGKGPANMATPVAHAGLVYTSGGRSGFLGDLAGLNCASYKLGVQRFRCGAFDTGGTHARIPLVWSGCSGPRSSSLTLIQVNGQAEA